MPREGSPTEEPPASLAKPAKVKNLPLKLEKRMLRLRLAATRHVSHATLGARRRSSMATVTLTYETTDVFSGVAFGGNPLAVVFGAEGLPSATLQKIAAEFCYSETTFVLPPSDPARTARVRIFTPVAELPFAGHPNVGTAFVLARRGEAFGRPVGTELAFEEQAGLVQAPCRGRGVRDPR